MASTGMPAAATDEERCRIVLAMSCPRSGAAFCMGRLG